MTGRHAMSTRLRTEEFDRLVAYADEHDLSLNEALHKLIRDNIGPTGRRCQWSMTVEDDSIPCTTPITNFIVYTGSSGRVLAQDTVCPAHEAEALARPRGRGTRLTATLKPIQVPS